MAMEILDAFGQLTREKAIDKSEVIELVKAGMLAAVRRKYGPEANADIVIDPATGKIGIYLLKEVVADEQVLEDPSRQMTIAEAKDLPYVNEPWGDGDPQPDSRSAASDDRVLACKFHVVSSVSGTAPFCS